MGLLGEGSGRALRRSGPENKLFGMMVLAWYLPKVQHWYPGRHHAQQMKISIVVVVPGR